MLVKYIILVLALVLCTGRLQGDKLCPLHFHISRTIVNNTVNLEKVDRQTIFYVTENVSVKWTLYCVYHSSQHISTYYCTGRHVRKVKEWFPLFCICARTVRFFVQKSQADRWAVELMKSEKFCLHLRAAAGWPGPLSSLQLSFSFIFVHFWLFLTRKSKKVTEWNAKK